MKYLLFLFLLSSVNSFGQDVYEVPYVSPEFPGGPSAMAQFIQENFKYPICSIGDEVVGTIWISCMIEKDGTLTNVKIAKGLSDLFDREAVRVIKSMPNWKPGEDLNGDVDRIEYHIPIKIK